MRRGLHMGDELHSRNTATSPALHPASSFPYLLRMDSADREAVERTVQALTEDHYFFLRLSMAAAKCTADAAAGVDGASVVTAMAFNCRNFAIRVSGLGNAWFAGPPRHRPGEAVRRTHGGRDRVDGRREPDRRDPSGSAASPRPQPFPCSRYQGGSAEAMVERNLEMYEITVGENPGLSHPLSRLSRHAYRNRYRARRRDENPACGYGHRHRGARRRPDRRRRRPSADRMLRSRPRRIPRPLRRHVSAALGTNPNTLPPAPPPQGEGSKGVWIRRRRRAALRRFQPNWNRTRHDPCRSDIIFLGTVAATLGGRRSDPALRNRCTRVPSVIWERNRHEQGQARPTSLTAPTTKQRYRRTIRNLPTRVPARRWVSSCASTGSRSACRNSSPTFRSSSAS